MSDAMATGRMPQDKKAQGARILQREGLSASQAINLLYDRLIQEGNAGFLLESPPPQKSTWENAACFVDSLSRKQTTRFDNMSKAEIRTDRLKKRGLM